VQLLATPVLAITLTMLMFERATGVGIFDPALGGDPVLYQHMFWFYSHPAVYIMILPAMGVASEVVAAFTRKKIFGYKFVAYSSLAIAFLGFLVWAHHLFVAGISVYSALIFAFLSYFVAVPSAIKVFNWTATLYKASVSWQTPMLYILGFIGLFTIAVSRVFSFRRSASTSTSPTLTLSWPTSITSWSAACHGLPGWDSLRWPKITGRMYPEWWPAWRRCSSSSASPDLLPAVHPRLPRHAAPLSRVRAGVPGPERHVDCRRLGARRRLPAADHLPDVVTALRP